MVTIAHITKKILREKPFIHEALEQELINIVALSEYLKPEIEKEIGKVKTSAISMAVRRYVESNRNEYKKFKITKRIDISIKSNLCELSLQKTNTVFRKLMKLYDVVNFDIGDTLNIIQGNYEILIVSNEKYEKKFRQILDGENIKAVNRNMAAISLPIPDEIKNQCGQTRDNGNQ